MSFPFEYRGRIKLDANRITDSGFYYADGQSSNVDNSSFASTQIM